VYIPGVGDLGLAGWCYKKASILIWLRS